MQPRKTTKMKTIAFSQSVSLTLWADLSQGRFISKGDVVVVAVGDVWLLATSFKALNRRRGIMAAIVQSQLYGYFYKLLFIVRSATELKHLPLCDFVLVLLLFNENIDSVLWYVISFCLQSDTSMLLHICRCAVLLS